MSSGAQDGDQQLIGRVIAGKLRIVEHLGSGSMGRVYRAHHAGLDKDVAIKVLRESVVPDPNRSRRFAREARAASRLNHPNSVAVLDFGEDGDDKLLYIAMEFLEGEDLQEVIDRGALLGVDRVCHIMIQVLAALAAAHDADIIHRDMKPSNIVLVKQRNDEGLIAEVVKVCDFGVAKFMGGARDTLDGGKAHRVIGTPLYMSPEQAVGDALDPRTDVYSCGVIMYEMLTGHPPFGAETPMGVLMKHVSEPVKPPSSLVPGIPIELEAMIMWSLEKDRTKRPSSARELRNAVRAYLAGKAGTIPELTRYGVEGIEGASPWSGPTPYWQIDMPTPPRTQDSPILAAPPLPPPLAKSDPAAGASRSPKKPALDLISDLEGGSSAGKPPAPSDDPPAWEAPPRGAQVPAALLDSYTQLDEIFSDDSFFQFRDKHQARMTIPPDEVQLYAPPPRALTHAHDTDPKLVLPKAGGVATHLGQRFSLSPDRQPPADGLWMRDARGRQVGPCTWSEVTRALRLDAAETPSRDEISVSADRRAWISGRRFVELTGVEAIVDVDEALPADSNLTGSMPQRSAAFVFAELTTRSATGRMIFQVRSGRRRAKFEVHVDQGRATYVATNEPQLQMPDLLVAKGVVPEDRLAVLVRGVIDGGTTLAEAIGRDVELDVTQYGAAVMKERLRHLLRWPTGRFALDERTPPISAGALGVSLLSLLPDLVYRTMSSERLEAELQPILELPLAGGPGATEKIAAMGLTRSQRAVAERILASPRLGRALPPDGRIRKAYTTMAYVLRESGLLEVLPARTS